MQYFFFLIVISFPLFTQEKVDKMYVHQPKNEPQYSSNIRKTEVELNRNISKANEAFAEYSKVLSMKVNTLPHRTIVRKGIAIGENCITKLDTNESEINCIKIEQFDFIEGERGESNGPKNKSLTLFFAMSSNREGESKAKLLKIKSKVFSHNLYTYEKKMIEVIDTDPLGNPDHDDKIFIKNQIDPLTSNSESDEEGAGRYQLNSLENTKSNPLRNIFKKEAYIKHLLLFEKTLSKIYNYNEVPENKKEKNTTKLPEKNLKN